VVWVALWGSKGLPRPGDPHRAVRGRGARPGPSVAVAGGGRWELAHGVLKRRGSKRQLQGAMCSPVRARGSRAGRGGPSMGTRRAVPHRQRPPALHQARGDLVAGWSAQSELLWPRDGAANRGGGSPLGGEPAEMARRMWAVPWQLAFLGAHQAGEGRAAGPGLLQPRAKSAGGPGVVGVRRGLGMLKVPGDRGCWECRRCRGAGAERAGVAGGGAWGAGGAPRARGAQAAGKGCSCPGSGHRLAEAAREMGAMAGGPLRA